MGHMLRETRFVQVFRRLYFVKSCFVCRRMMFGTNFAPTSPAIATVRIWRLWPCTEANRPKNSSSSPTGSSWSTSNRRESPMVRTSRTSSGRRPRPPDIATCHQDETAEMAQSLWQVNEQNEREIAREILVVSPYHPLARGMLISRDWDAVKDKVPTWEKESGRLTRVLAALGSHYSKAKQYDDAQRILARYMDSRPTSGLIRRWPQTSRPRARSTAGKRRSTSS